MGSQSVGHDLATEQQDCPSVKVFHTVRTLNVSCLSFLACKVSASYQLRALWRFPCMWLFVLLLPPLEFSFSLTFAILIMIWLDMDLFWVILLGTLWASCFWISVSFFRVGTFSAIISSNTFRHSSLSIFLLEPQYSVSWCVSFWVHLFLNSLGFLDVDFCFLP